MRKFQITIQYVADSTGNIKAIIFLYRIMRKAVPSLMDLNYAIGFFGLLLIEDCQYERTQSI